MALEHHANVPAIKRRGSTQKATGDRNWILFFGSYRVIDLVRSHKERRFSILGPTQSRKSSSIL